MRLIEFFRGNILACDELSKRGAGRYARAALYLIQAAPIETSRRHLRDVGIDAVFEA